MGSRNDSTVAEFILLGLSTDPTVQLLLFQFFLLVYMATLSGNILLIMAVICDRRLHNSMYFFLVNLSFINLCGTSVTMPKTLANFLYESKSISFAGCLTQIFFYLVLGESECILLVFMAYDRFVAICNPLRYGAVMSRSACARMVAGTWMTSFVISSVDIVFVYQLTFCGPNIINHYCCEIPSLLHLSCGDTSVMDGLRFGGSIFFLPVPLLLILCSYYKIVVSIIRIQSGRYKAFSTCFSHLIVVSMFYGAGMFMYLRPRRTVADNLDKIVSIFYTAITPTLNPLIYSLRNKDVLRALGRLGRLMLRLT
ncbi:olfactory receptor 2D3-like [Pelodytes ibericus]